MVEGIHSENLVIYKKYVNNAETALAGLLSG